MKRYVLKLILLVLCLNGFTQEKDFNLNFLQEINISRKNMNIPSMNLDSSLVYALNEINKRTSMIEGDEDSIRAILSSLNNHDYQIKLLKIGLEEKKSIDPVELLKNNKDLFHIVSDSCYNMIGYTKVEEANNDYLLVLATQNYIQFEDNLFGEIYTLDGGGYREFITLSGSSVSDSIVYKLNNKKLIKNYSLGSDCKNIIKDENGRFSIKIDMINFRQQNFDCITFYSKSGKIIANFKLQ